MISLQFKFYDFNYLNKFEDAMQNAILQIESNAIPPNSTKSKNGPNSQKITINPIYKLG
jgi:hypothetical protein